MRPRNALAFALLLAACAAPSTADEPKRPANRLAQETSPYLRLHAHNPVDWYPWGTEAFEKAKAEDRPIFLSIGYSSCYWCHVMERQCFMDEAIAKVLNEQFVCIKVDREERPDVDQIYMTALQAFSGGGGGWPLSIFMTPDGRPFFGGTYFPPKDRDDLPGFPKVLAAVHDAWVNHRDAIEKDADALRDVVRKRMAAASGRRLIPPRAVADDCRAALAEQFDPDFGGFGYDPTQPARPKFPEPPNLVFLLDQHRRNPGRGAAPGVVAAKLKGPSPLAMVVQTLDHLARGGIRDQLAGGYHRYSTNRSWTVPHFEKMLYDNAQLASVLVRAHEITGDARWKAEADATFAFVARSLTAPDGAFYSALDAETDGDEGGYYAWKRDEVKTILGDDDYKVFAAVYGLDRDPNFDDDRYVLHEPRPRADVAAALNTTPEALEARLAPLRAKLLEARERRPQPLRDEKILTSWNGLMIAAYADAYRVFKDDRYREAAETAADYLWKVHRRDDGRLLRTSRDGRAKLDGYLEDYAFLAWGLLRLHVATGDRTPLRRARELADRMVADFADAEGGGFFSTAAGAETLIARPKDPFDNALPSGNSVAVRLLVELFAVDGDPADLQHAGETLAAFGASLTRIPAGMPVMVVGLLEYRDALPAAAREPDAAAAPPKTDAVVAAEATATAGAKPGPGGEFDAAVTIRIKKPYHLYANPSRSETARPTVLALPDGSGATVVKVDYPAGEVKELAGESVAVYEGETTVKLRLRLDADAAPGALSLPFRLKYQACDDRACLAPATLEVPLEVEVVKEE